MRDIIKEKGQRNKRACCRRGSMTIEASFIMPIVLSVLFLMFYLMFFLYDRGVIYGDAYIAAFRACEEVDAENEIAWQRADAVFRELMINQTIALSELEKEITVNYEGVTIAYQGSVVTPLTAQENGTGFMDVFSFSGEAGAQRHKPVTFIRGCKKLEALAGSAGQNGSE